MKKIFLFIVLFFFCIINVNAQENTLKDVADKMKTTDIYELFDSEEDPIVLQTTDDSLIITSLNSSEENSIKFDFSNDVISWRFLGDKNNSSDLSSVFVEELWIVDIIYAVGLLNGYTEEQMNAWMNSEDDTKLDNLSLEENGIEMTYYSFEFNEEDSSFSGTIIDTFKIDINKFNVGDIVVPDESYKEKIIADVEILEIKDTSIKFKINAEVNDEDTFCYLYRSSKKDFDLTTDDLFIRGASCNSVIIDDELTPGTTYYYRTLVDGKNMNFDNDSFGEVIEVTTKEKINGASSNNDNKFNNNFSNNENITDNPKTSVNIVVFSIIILMFFSCFALFYYFQKYSETL